MKIKKGTMNTVVAILFGISFFVTAAVSSSILGAGTWFWQHLCLAAWRHFCLCGFIDNVASNNIKGVKVILYSKKTNILMLH